MELNNNPPALISSATQWQPCFPLAMRQFMWMRVWSGARERHVFWGLCFGHKLLSLCVLTTVINAAIRFSFQQGCRVLKTFCCSQHSIYYSNSCWYWAFNEDDTYFVRQIFPQQFKMQSSGFAALQARAASTVTASSCCQLQTGVVITKPQSQLRVNKMHTIIDQYIQQCLYLSRNRLIWVFSSIRNLKMLKDAKFLLKVQSDLILYWPLKKPCVKKTKKQQLQGFSTEESCSSTIRFNLCLMRDG